MIHALSPQQSAPRVIVALDFPDARAALALADQLDPTRCRLKVGKELFTRAGPSLVSALVDRGFGVFLDLKFHDIPNTVAGACRAAVDLGVWMLNVHASGGRRMLEAARRAVEAQDGGPLLIAVTVLTSLGPEDLLEVGITADPAAQVMRLARLTADCGLDGVVCSPLEVAALDAVRPEAGRWVLVTPGIRPASASRTDDQRRTLGPAQALAAGADFLVIGRPVTQAQDPVAALAAILGEIGQASIDDGSR